MITLRHVETLANALNGFKGTVTESNRCQGNVKLFHRYFGTRRKACSWGIPFTMKNSFLGGGKLRDRGGEFVYVFPPNVNGKCVL
jgi:hypothetical protein